MKILFVNTHFYKPHSYGRMAITPFISYAAVSCVGDISWRCLRVWQKQGSFRRTQSYRHEGEAMALGRFGASRNSRLGYTVWRTWFPETIVPW